MNNIEYNKYVLGCRFCNARYKRVDMKEKIWEKRYRTLRKRYVEAQVKILELELKLAMNFAKSELNMTGTVEEEKTCDSSDT